MMAADAPPHGWRNVQAGLLGPGARVTEPMAPGHVSLDDPAFSVMTDLREVAAASTTPDETIGQAHAQMIRRGVRLLFVLDPQKAVAGVITATDLLGEKPMRFMQSHGVSHAEIQVGDIMTPAAMLDALPLMDVAQMRVGHIVATMKALFGEVATYFRSPDVEAT